MTRRQLTVCYNHRLDLKTHAVYAALYGKRAPESSPVRSSAIPTGFMLLDASIGKIPGSTYYLDPPAASRLAEFYVNRIPLAQP